MKPSNPQPIYLKDYQVPPYLIDKIELDVRLEEEITKVKSRMEIRDESCEPFCF